MKRHPGLSVTRTVIPDQIATLALCQHRATCQSVTKRVFGGSHSSVSNLRRDFTFATCLVSPLSVVNLRSHIRQKKGRCSCAAALFSWFLWCCCRFDSCAKAFSHPTKEHLYGRSPNNEKATKCFLINLVFSKLIWQICQILLKCLLLHQVPKAELKIPE